MFFLVIKRHIVFSAHFLFCSCFFMFLLSCGFFAPATLAVEPDTPLPFAFQTSGYSPFQSGEDKILVDLGYCIPDGNHRRDRVFHTGSSYAAETPERSQKFLSFPAMTGGSNGELWVAVIARPQLIPQILVYRLTDFTQSGLLLTQPFQVVQPAEARGIGRPAIAETGDGCFVVFPVEVSNRWKLAYTRINSQNKKRIADINYLETDGVSNISPVITRVGTEFCLVWEANENNRRGIYTAWLSANGSATGPQLISGAEYNSYNPDVIASSDGRVFAAWDSTRNYRVNLYGAYWIDGHWGQEIRLTDHRRIERHVSLACHENEFWMAWQAQSFQGSSINKVTEQRIVVAQLSDNELLSPYELFTTLSTDDDLLLVPMISFDTFGRLWLTARKSLWSQGGWKAVIWSYCGNSWTRHYLSCFEHGRPQPVPIVLLDEHMAVASQFDSIPDGNSWMGENPDWDSQTRISFLPLISCDSPVCLEKLDMPETTFNLSDYFRNKNTEQKGQTIQHSNQSFHLYFGDLHSHSTISGCMPAINLPVQDLFANQRDIDLLDFAAITDHGFSFDGPRWMFLKEQVRCNNDPAKFLTFLGQEWTSNHKTDPPGYGHHNIIHLDPDWEHFYDAWDGHGAYATPKELWDLLDSQGAQYITIPHQLADDPDQLPGDRGCRPKNWDFFNESSMPLAEICQMRGAYEYLNGPLAAYASLDYAGNYLRDAWAKGIIIGTIASSDHYGGRGKVGVWAEELTPEKLFEAFRARHTFGTSGAKISLLLTADNAIMGDKVRRTDDSPIHFQIHVEAGQSVSEVCLFRGYTQKGIDPLVTDVYTTIERNEPLTSSVCFTCSDPSPPNEADTIYYYARVQTANNEFAWSSPIWFSKEYDDISVPTLTIIGSAVLFLLLSILIIARSRYSTP